MINSPTIERAHFLLHDAIALAEHGGVHTGAALLEIIGASIDHEPAVWDRELVKELHTVSNQYRRRYAPALLENDRVAADRALGLL